MRLQKPRKMPDAKVGFLAGKEVFRKESEDVYRSTALYHTRIYEG